jgi:hypothetical protein
MRTGLPIDTERKIDLHTVKFLPNYRSCNLATISSWNPLTTVVKVQTSLYRLRCSPRCGRRVRLSQGTRWLSGTPSLLQKPLL